MKDRLEEFIEQHRSGFDVYDPPENLWRGIRKRKASTLRSRKSVRILLQTAAAAAIFIAAWYLHGYADRQNMTGIRNSQLYREVPELKEAEFYYERQVSVKMKELQPYFRQVPGLSHEVSEDLSELDSVCVSLKRDLKDNVANDEVIEAMIRNYRMKLEILEDLLQQLKGEQNPDQYETNESVI